VRTGRWFMVAAALAAVVAFGIQPSPAAMGMGDELKTAITHAGFA